MPRLDRYLSKEEKSENLAVNVFAVAQQRVSVAFQGLLRLFLNFRGQGRLQV